MAVAEQPPITAALAPYVPASGPCARRRPNSNTGSPWAAKHTLDALVAISDWKLIIVSKAVSISCAWYKGAFTVSIGSLGNIIVPSSTAYISPVNLKSFKNVKNLSENRFKLFK